MPASKVGGVAGFVPNSSERVRVDQRYEIQRLAALTYCGDGFWRYLESLDKVNKILGQVITKG